MAIFQKNGNWYVDYYVNGKRKREMVGTSKALARKVDAKRKVQIAEGKYLDIQRAEKIKFREFKERYLNNHSKPNKKSWQEDVYNFNLLDQIFGDCYMDEITPELIEKFKAKEIKGHELATFNRKRALLSNMFTKAIEWGVLHGPNPVQKVKRFKENNTRVRYLDIEEIDKLLKVVQGALRTVIIVALNTGMRKGEIQEIKWSNIDFQNNTIRITRQKNGKTSYQPINETVREALKKLPKGESGYLFNFDWKKSFRTAVTKAGIMNFRFHDLRHTFASHLVMRGYSIYTVMVLLRHSDTKTSQRYAHLAPNYTSAAVRSLDTIWTPRPDFEAISVSKNNNELIVQQ